jgi:hypothetical protein
MLATIPTTDLFAGNDWNDSCYNTGYEDGQNGPFSQPTYDHCGVRQAAILHTMIVLLMDVCLWKKIQEISVNQQQMLRT